MKAVLTDPDAREAVESGEGVVASQPAPWL